MESKSLTDLIEICDGQIQHLKHQQTNYVHKVDIDDISCPKRAAAQLKGLKYNIEYDFTNQIHKWEEMKRQLQILLRQLMGATKFTQLQILDEAMKEIEKHG